MSPASLVTSTAKGRTPVRTRNPVPTGLATTIASVVRQTAAAVSEICPGCPLNCTPPPDGDGRGLVEPRRVARQHDPGERRLGRRADPERLELRLDVGAVHRDAPLA